MVAGYRHANLRLLAGFEVQDRAAGALFGQQLAASHHKPTSGAGRDQIFSRLIGDEHGGDIVFVGQLRQNAHGLAVAASARQFGGLQRVGAAIGAEQT